MNRHFWCSFQKVAFCDDNFYDFLFSSLILYFDEAFSKQRNSNDEKQNERRRKRARAKETAKMKEGNEFGLRKIFMAHISKPYHNKTITWNQQQENQNKHE